MEQYTTSEEREYRIKEQEKEERKKEQDAADALDHEATLKRIWNLKKLWIGKQKHRVIKVCANWPMFEGAKLVNTICVWDTKNGKLVVSYACNSTFNEWCRKHPDMFSAASFPGVTYYTLIGEEFKELSPSQLFKKYPIDQDYYHATAKLKPGGKVTAEEMTTFFGKDKVKEVVYFVCRKHSATLVCTLKST